MDDKLRAVIAAEGDDIPQPPLIGILKSFPNHRGIPGHQGGSLPKSEGEYTYAYHRTTAAAAENIRKNGFSMDYYGKGGGLGLFTEPYGIYVSPIGTEQDYAMEVANRGLNHDTVLKVAIPVNKVWRPTKEEFSTEFTKARRTFIINKYKLAGRSDVDALVDAFMSANKPQIMKLMNISSDAYRTMMDYNINESHIEMQKTFSKHIMDMGYTAVEWTEPVYHVHQMMILDPKAIKIVKERPVGVLKSFPNHRGILGHQGGSLPANVILDKLPGEIGTYYDMPDNMYKSYLVTGDGRLVHMPDEHALYPYQSGQPELFGMTADEAKSFYTQYESSGGRANLDNYWQKFFSTGTIRLLEYGDELDIETAKLDRATLQRIQRLVDDDKIVLKGKIIWTSVDTRIWNSFTPDEFMSAKYVKIDDRFNLILKSFPDHRGILGHRGGSLPRDEEDVWGMPVQEITSARTSINGGILKTGVLRMPATFKKVDWQPGTVNADIGGGKYDNATIYLQSKGVENLIYDPFNRDQEHNQAVVSRIRGGQADTATVNNVLNVIKEPANRLNVIRQAVDAIKPTGTAYFIVYEGSRSGEGKQTAAGWQENRALSTYVDEVRKGFRTVKTSNGMIIASDPIKLKPMPKP